MKELSMKKINILIIIVLCLSALNGCSSRKKDYSKTNEHAQMLYVHDGSEMAINLEEDILIGYTYIIYYDAQIEYIEYYSISGTSEKKTGKMSDEDFESLYGLIDTELPGYNTKEYENGYFDGGDWTFLYTDNEGNEIYNDTVLLVYDDFQTALGNIVSKYR